jgi:hypothetical protein
MKKSALKKGRWKRTEYRYGKLWEAVKREPCFLSWHVPGHKCGIGVRPATAHHLGRLDAEGLVPCCGKAHDLCHDQPWRVRKALDLAGAPTLEEIGMEYVRRARS